MNSTRMPFVVMVDDDIDFLTDAAAVLEGRGFRVRTLTSPDRAARMVRSLRPDLVLLDLDMPGRSGLSVLSELRAKARTRFTPVILVTAHREAEVAIEGFRRGLDDCVYKPFSLLDLDARMRALLRRSQAAPGSLMSGFEAAAMIGRNLGSAEWTLWMEVPNYQGLVLGTGGEVAAHTRSVLFSLGERLCDFSGAAAPSIYEPEPGVFLVLFSAALNEATAVAMTRATKAAVRLSAWKGAGKTFLIHDGTRLIEQGLPRPVFARINAGDCGSTYEALKAAREVGGAFSEISFQ